MRKLSNIYWLGTKELHSFFSDYVLLGFTIYAFSFMVISMAQSNTQELHNASLAIVDEDHSPLSRQIVSGFLPPYFKKPEPIEERDIDRLMNVGRYTFVLDIPPHFERDVRAGRSPALQLLVDATAMIQAGIGSSYATQIIDAEVAKFVSRSEPVAGPPVTLAIRVAFNPNVSTAWFLSVMGIINNITMLAMILAGAAVLRERERGTMDHLLVMPLTPIEIALAKVWANGLIIAVAAGLSLEFVVQRVLHVPINGSVALFMLGTGLYLFFATAIGIYFATVARTMPQLGLILMLVSMPMNILSGSSTPLESQPEWLRTAMQVSPSTHFVSFAQAILYRGAGFSDVWPRFLAVALIASLFLGLAVVRFRRVTGQST